MSTVTRALVIPHRTVEIHLLQIILGNKTCKENFHWIIWKKRCLTTHVVLIISLFSQKKKQIADIMRQLAGPVRLLFATEAYGMGADAPDIRHIFHIGPPNSIECRYMPRHEKTGFLPMRKQRRRSASQ